MTKRITVSLLLVPMLLLSACAAGKPGPAAESDTPPPSKKEPAQLSVYFPYPADWPEEEFMKTFGQPIMKKFPHVTIKYIPGGKISELLAAGQTIDIVFPSTGPSPGTESTRSCPAGQP